MRRSRFSEEQIIRILQEAESVGEVARRHGLSAETVYRWCRKFGGLEVSEARRLHRLEQEYARLKRVVADQAVENQVLKDLLKKFS